jgi:FkbM family methyltransferase
MKPIEKSFETFLGKITLYENETFITREFNNNKYWDIDVLLKVQNYIDPYKNILEIGGHCGTSSLFYASLLKKKKKVFVYEPQKKLFNLLLKNINDNYLNKKIKAFNKAFFCKEGFFYMNKTDIDGGGGVVEKRYNEQGDLPCNFGGIGLGIDGEKVLTTTLDKCKIKKIGFIHCDAQGAENFIFSEGKKFLKKNRPVILYENNKKYNPKLFNNVLESYKENLINSHFDVEEYCINVLGYSKVIHNFNTEDDLLIP